MSPDGAEAPAVAAARPQPSPYGPIARAERVGSRWRDVEWVEFTVAVEEAPGSAAPAAELACPPPAAEPAVAAEAAPVPSARPARRLASPDPGAALRRFANPLGRRARAKSDPIAGLCPRFSRVPMVRTPPDSLEPEIAPPWLARLAEPLRREAVIQLELPVPPAAGEPPPLRLETPWWPSPVAVPAVSPPRDLGSRATSDALPPRVVPGVHGETPFPASFYISTTAATSGAEPTQPARAALAAALHRLVAALRRAARGDGGLRLSALITVAVMLVAAIAYGGRALLSGRVDPAAKPSASAEPPPPVARTAMLVAPPRVVPAVTKVSNAAVSRAASYLARAKAGEAAAQYDVGVLYATGDGLVQDYASAASWFRAAAAQGNVDAEYNLGVLYERGLGVAPDQGEALNWYRSAADQNHAAAQFNLAVAYAEGRGAAQDFAAAARWYLRAARQGLSPAMINLAILYEQGEGVERSPVDAYAWYSAAAARGAADAKDRAGQLIRQFSDQDKARAEALAATLGASLDPASSRRPPA